MDDVLVVCDRPGEGIARLTLNRPAKKNALSVALRDAVSDQLDQLADDETVKVVVITGAGDTFSAGFDLKEFTSDVPAVQAALWPSSDRFHHTVLRYPLHDLVGGAARDLCFTGRSIDAAEALRIGLVSRVTPDAHLEAAALELAAQIAQGPREVLVRTKAKVIARLSIPVATATLGL